MSGGVKKQMVDISISLPTAGIGAASFASGTKERKIYSLGLEAGIKLVMEYWGNGTDMETASTNIDFVKKMLFDNKTWGTEKKK